jgi:hypothetical protein
MKLTLYLASLSMLAMVVSCAGHDDNRSSATTQGESKPDTELARKFVQEFYDWYVPIAVNGHSGRASDLALQSRHSAFDSSLAGQLKEDSSAQAKVQGDIVGLDFDPFVAAQDPCERYEVVNVRSKAQSYLVDVRGVGGCEKHSEPDLTAEVVFNNGAWLFTNFHYPGPLASDLLTILKKLRADRQ